MAREVTANGSEAVGWTSGRVSGTAAHQTKLAGGPTEAEEQIFLAQHLEHESCLMEMSELLKADGSDEMLEWEQRLCPTDKADFPANLRRPAEKLDWCGLEIPDPL